MADSVFKRELGAEPNKIQPVKRGRELRARLDQFELIFDALPFLIFLKDTKNNILRANSAVGKSMGVCPERMAGTPTAMWYPDEADDYYKDDLEVIRTKSSMIGIVEQVSLGGKKTWVRSDKFPTFDPDGSVNGVLVFVQDATEEQKIRSRLEHSETFLESIVEHLPHMLFVKEAKELRFVRFNRAGEELLGYQKSDLIGKNDYDFFPKEQADYFTLKDRKVLRQGKLEVIEEEPIDTKSGRRLLRTKKIPICGPDGSPKYLLGISEDITDRREAEKVARESDERLRLALSVTNDGVWDWNIKTGEAYFSPSWCNSLGYHPEEIEGHIDSWKNLLHPEDRERVLRELDAHLAGETDSYTCENRLRRKDGTYRWNLDRGRVIQWDSDGRPERMVGVDVDISDQRTLIEELRIAKERAESATKAKSEFLANMSHEIRTPMNGILGVADLLQDAALNSEQQELADILRLSSNSLLTVINDILDFSKIEASKVELHPRPFSLAIFLDGVYRGQAHRFQDKFITYSATIDEALPETVVGDSDRLQQVLLNLLGNSLKFTSNGGSISLQSTLLERDEESCLVRFSVQDSGIGIDKRQQDRIFEAFNQADSGITREFGGTGLGLAISSELVRLMGGEIQVSSQVGEGSTFSFTCRFGLLRTEASQQVSEVELPTDLERSRSLRILVAEDNQINQKLLLRLLEREGHQVEVASNGEEVLGRFKSGYYDVVLMDIQMPKVNGMQATRSIRAIEKCSDGSRRTPVVALTAHAMHGDRERFLQAGMDGYISKPINREDLLRLIYELAG